MAAQVAHVADFNGHVGARLPLHIEGVVDRIRQLVLGVVGAHGEGNGAGGNGVGVGQVLRNVGSLAGGRRSQGCAPGLGEVGVGGIADGNVAVVEVGLEVRAGLRVHKGLRLADAERAAMHFAGGISGREVGEQFAAVVVESAAAAHHHLVVEFFRRPGKAQARPDAPLSSAQRGVVVVFRHNITVAVECAAGVGGISGRTGVVEAGVEVVDVAVLLAQSAVQVPADAGRQAQVGANLVLILQVKAGLVGAIVAVAIALQEGGGLEVFVGGDQTLDKFAEVRRSGGSGHAGTPIAGIQLRVRPASAKGQGVIAERPDAVARRHEAILKDAGQRALVRTGPDVQGLDCGSGWGIGAQNVDDGNAGIIVGSKVVDAHCVRTKGLVVGGVDFLANHTQSLGHAQIRAEDIDVIDGEDLAARIHVLVKSRDVREGVWGGGRVVLVVVLERQGVLGAGVPVQIAHQLIGNEVGRTGKGDVIRMVDGGHAARVGNEPLAALAGDRGLVHQVVGDAAAGVGGAV